MGTKLIVWICGRIVYVESVLWVIEHMQVRTKTFHKIVYSIVKGLGNFMICNVLS